jgi:peptidyl-prolyl cis-trans isomerase C
MTSLNRDRHEFWRRAGRWARVSAAAALLNSPLSCHEASQSAPPVASAALPSGAVANVAGEIVSVETVQRIAQAKQLPARAASELAVTDALFAAHARSSLPTGRVAHAEAAVLARALVEELRRAAERTPITTEERAAALDALWSEVDRPSTVRTTHAVVRLKDGADPKRAEALAQQIAEAVAGARDSDDFRARASAVPAQGLELRVEKLPFITLDGRQPESGGRFDVDFANAAHALANEGDLSPVVKTAFGFHVIRLEERAAPKQSPPAVREQRLARWVYEKRATEALEKELKRLRTASPVAVSRGAETLTAQVPQ